MKLAVSRDANTGISSVGGSAERLRHLIIVLGDQLSRDSAAFDGFDTETDAVMMCESTNEATCVPQHRQRLVLFFSAMRHFRADLAADQKAVFYSALDDVENVGSLAGEVERRVRQGQPERLIVLHPGDYRVLDSLKRVACSLGVPLEIRPDRHFIDTIEGFARYAGRQKSLRLETYYRGLRKRHGILMNSARPVGDRWNFDADNRKALPKGQQLEFPSPLRFAPDAITRTVMSLVQARFPDAPGRLDSFQHPVSARDAAYVLDDFIAHRLPRFGQYQDAMAVGEPHLFHSLLSTSLNLHLLDPRDAIKAAVSVCTTGHVPLNSVEGFVRQVLGWREYIRGIYWWQMPGYAEFNALGAVLPMPAFMWTGETQMNCVRECIGQLNAHGYAHHIQRLMVLGLFAMLLGVNPNEVHRWHMSMNIDAVDWVSLPNVIGMSQYADGGIVGSKPYCASGNYINKMSDYCKNCRYEPRRAAGEGACPFSTLYWDFLDRHSERLRLNGRMTFQLRHLARKSNGEMRAIRAKAANLKTDYATNTLS